ncbi:MAG: hypothetical protein B7733_15220 [Myxococcales bacterium FL481]|nr:MAG: hypothetical protein B7733_15220 [Myxococcales bacterium FL481]
MTLLRTLALLSLVATTTACDVHLLPELGTDAGEQSTRMTVHIGGVGADSLGDEVQEVRVNVIDVLVHRVEDDSWVILNTDGIEAELVAEDQRSSNERLPVVLGGYDRVLLALDHAEVLVDESWEPAMLARTEVEVTADLWVQHGSELQIDFDLYGAVLRSPVDGWSFEPNPTAYTR